MSIITSKNKTNSSNKTREPSEFDGMYINVGINTKQEDGSVKFVQLPRGIFVSDLTIGKIYPGMDSDHAAEVTLKNRMVIEIQKACRALEEGESLPSDMFSVEIYRRNEEVVVSEEDTAPLGLFG